jgi:excisionase family DNA binding protein
MFAHSNIPDVFRILGAATEAFLGLWNAIVWRSTGLLIVGFLTTITTTADADPWLTLREAAQRARCHEATLRRLIRAGTLRYARLGRKHIRIRASWVDEAIERAATPIEVPND